MEYRNKLLQGDCLEVLRQLPDNTFHCCISSPPYYALRDYGVEGQIGLEGTPREYIDKMVAVYREVRRVLRQDGTCWINIGDSYATGVGGFNPQKANFIKGQEHTRRAPNGGLIKKNLLLIPQRLAIALQDDGWIIRSDIIWSKPGPMPESVQDRPTKAHEYVWMVTKKPHYWYDADAVREKSGFSQFRGSTGIKSGANGSRKDGGRSYKNLHINGQATHSMHENRANGKKDIQYQTRNLRTVWTIPGEPSDLPHYAMFPRKLITPMILAGCPHKVCAVCGKGWVREVEVSGGTWEKRKSNGAPMRYGMNNNKGESITDYGTSQHKTLGFHAACACHTTDTTPGLVLDMFAGTGTTGLVARDFGRDYTLIELSPEYVDIARQRLDMPYTLPMPMDV